MQVSLVLRKIKSTARFSLKLVGLQNNGQMLNFLTSRLLSAAGACTHGDRCSRIHNKPTFSQTVLLSNLYINPQNSAKTADGSHLANVTDQEMQEHYDNFFEDVFVECEDKYGQVIINTEINKRIYCFGSCQVEEMNVCDNLGDHLVGNVYVKFKKEDVSFFI